MITSSVVQFDPSIKEHRRDYFTLYNTNCFGKLKNKYSLEGNYGSLYNMMTEKVAQYYSSKEFI